jgi:hypothetical protein
MRGAFMWLLLYKLKTMDDDKKSFFRNWQLIQNFFITHLPILVRCKTKGAVGAGAPYWAIGN